MQNRSVSIIIALVLVLGIGGFVYFSKHDTSSSDDVSATSAGSESINPGGGLIGNPDIGNINPAGASSTPASSLALADVASHNSRTSCWAAINGSVYDLTSWIPHHPGGEQAILSLCGTDGSAAFDRKHGRDPRAQSILSGFKIGSLAQ